jgi:AraC family transcriptional regulator of adaptative response/methylated-DNA-[protein]-cysteine methyltransferase
MTDDNLWCAVAERDARFDGILFYGVITTGVYCRPSCPSRRPRRDNTRFFVTSQAAERAGLRPCRRCRPDTLELPTGASARVAAACRIAFDECDVTSNAIAARLGLSSRGLRRAFAEVLGLSPGAMLTAARTERLRIGLRRHGRVAEAGYAAGFSSSSRVYEGASQRLGMTPGQFAARGAGQAISYASARTALGWLTVAATDKGLCFARFGDGAAVLEQALFATFADATLVGAGDNAWIRALFEIAEQPSAWRELPVDIRGTVFQAKVWQALKAIPAGVTRTYAEVARAIGAPRAVRAVASACAANPVAIAVPCHRVVPKIGGSGGYRWGEARKRALLAAERGPVPQQT